MTVSKMLCLWGWKVGNDTEKRDEFFGYWLVKRKRSKKRKFKILEE